jgi:hypothetical protein
MSGDDRAPRSGRMAQRLMRRTMQPRRPLVYPDQWALVLLTVLVIGGGVVFAVLVLTG